MEIRSYAPSDLPALTAILKGIRDHDGGYPPAYIGDEDEAIAQWLDRYPAEWRLVAVEDGRVVGHVQVVEMADTDPDLPDFLTTDGRVEPSSCAEITRLFVDPGSRRHGVGRALLAAASERIEQAGARPALCVLTTQEAARELYRSAGWLEIGTFVGVSGVVNHALVAPVVGRMTGLVHSGVRPGPERGVVTPISVSTTFTMDHPGEYGEFAYARSANPTRKALEEALAAAEGATHGMAFSSGLAAIDAVCRLVRPGQEVLVGLDAYGGTWRLLDKVWSEHGVLVRAVDLTDPAAVDAAWGPSTALVMVETPSNPTLAITDITALAAVVRARGGLLVVDNTFATPWLQRPLALGAHVVVHSTTKYIGGHSDVIGGFLATDDDDLAQRFRFTQRAVGAVPGPFDSFLVLRGLRTLGLRMERHCDTAEAIAAVLAARDDVTTVHYPGLAAHPGHDVARRQMRRGGGMVSFVVAGGEERALRVCESTRVFTLAESLGAVESLIEHPGRMTHAANAGSLLAVDPGTIRLSVGIEDADDLVLDVTQALDRTR